MKKVFYACLTLAGLLTSAKPAQAQTIANLNFETWGARPVAEAPTNWQTTDDDFAAYFGEPTGYFNFGTVTKSTDKHGGAYAAKLTTISYQANNGSVVLPGELILGAKAGGSYTVLDVIPGGSPLATRPAQVQFYYKLTGTAAATDTAMAFVYLTKDTNGTPAILGGGYQVLAPTANYTSLAVPLTYNANTTAPDSIHILFFSGFANTITAGTSLYVDDVTISGANLATRADADIQAKLTVSPNPSTGGRFQLNAPDAPALASAPLTVSDMLGRSVAQQPALAVPSPTRELDLSYLASGIYLLRLDTKQGTVVRQLTIK